MKVGLIGSGGRGTGAARQALLADRDVKLWAVGDAFQDRTDECLRQLRLNPALAEINGRPIEALLGRTLPEALPDIAAKVSDAFRKYLLESIALVALGTVADVVPLAETLEYLRALPEGLFDARMPALRERAAVLTGRR